MHEFVITMNGYDLEGQFLNYVFKIMTGITRKLQEYIPTSQDISLVTRDSLPSFIKNIRNELATIRSLPFVTSESAHGTVEKCLGEDEAFRFVVECFLATDQHIHFSDEPNNEEEVAYQVQQALVTSRETKK